MNQVNMSVITSCLTGNEDDQHKAMQQVALMLVAVASKFCELDHVCSLSGIHWVLHRVKCVRVRPIPTDKFQKVTSSVVNQDIIQIVECFDYSKHQIRTVQM